MSDESYLYVFEEAFGRDLLSQGGDAFSIISSRKAGVAAVAVEAAKRERERLWAGVKDILDGSCSNDDWWWESKLEEVFEKDKEWWK